ncbi:MAG: hypothetical protein LUG93_14910 [Lachnospiraceae bacterium]|nr:hypothetical protein [Lachnospiraceae bacterium]
MKKFKKTAALIIAAAMCVGMNAGTVAYADTLEDEGSSSADVTATYKSSETATVYSVDITWGSLEFTYTEAGAQAWDPSTHTYTDSDEEDGGWSYEEGSNIVTITNHSNSAVGGKISCTTADAYAENVTLSMELESIVCENGGYEAVEYSYVGTADNVKYENVMYYLSNAAECALDDPDSAAYVETPLILSGDPDEFTESVTIGTVTITLTSAAGDSNIDEYLASQGYM